MSLKYLLPKAPSLIASKDFFICTKIHIHNLSLSSNLELLNLLTASVLVIFYKTHL